MPSHTRLDLIQPPLVQLNIPNGHSKISSAPCTKGGGVREGGREGGREGEGEGEGEGGCV